MSRCSPKIIDICIPTWESEPVISGTLEKLHQSVSNSDAKVGELILVDNNSNDNTVEIVRNKAAEYRWDTNIRSISSSLPQARKMAIDAVKTDWFLFLDDDVRIAQDYLSTIFAAVAPIIGAVQGRKKSKVNNSEEKLVTDVSNTNTDWVRKRSFRGGTHATLVRKEAVSDIQFPSDLEVWEDEYLRRHIESAGYLWLFNHQAVFAHESQERHSPSWKSGYLQAKYDMRPFWHVALNIPYAILTGKSPIGYVSMALGHLKGTFERYNSR